MLKPQNGDEDLMVLEHFAMHVVSTMQNLRESWGQSRRKTAAPRSVQHPLVRVPHGHSGFESSDAEKFGSIRMHSNLSGMHTRRYVEPQSCGVVDFCSLYIVVKDAVWASLVTISSSLDLLVRYLKHDMAWQGVIA